MTPACDPKPGGSCLTASAASTAFDKGGDPRFARFSPLAAPPGHRVGCKQRFKPGGSSGLDSQGLATILGPFPTIFGFLGPGLYLNI